MGDTGPESTVGRGAECPRFMQVALWVPPRHAAEVLGGRTTAIFWGEIDSDFSV